MGVDRKFDQLLLAARSNRDRYSGRRFAPDKMPFVRAARHQRCGVFLSGPQKVETAHAIPKRKQAGPDDAQTDQAPPGSERYPEHERRIENSLGVGESPLGIGLQTSSTNFRKPPIDARRIAHPVGPRTAADLRDRRQRSATRGSPRILLFELGRPIRGLAASM